MEDLFARIVLGHLVGDYLFQSKKMAIGKSERGWRGWCWCTLHSLIYTATVCLFLWTINPLVIFLIFLSHWPIDRWSLAKYWSKLIGGRDIMTAWASTDRWREIDLAFSCLVYAIGDNTMHLVLMWGVTKLL